MFKSFILSLSILSLATSAFAVEGLPDGSSCEYKDKAYLLERKDGGTLMGEHQLLVFAPVKKSNDYMLVKVYMNGKYETYSVDPNKVYLVKTDNVVR